MPDAICVKGLFITSLNYQGSKAASSGGGHGNPLQYSCLENPMVRGAWRAAVPGVAKSRTWLSDQAQPSKETSEARVQRKWSPWVTEFYWGCRGPWRPKFSPVNVEGLGRNWWCNVWSNMWYMWDVVSVWCDMCVISINNRNGLALQWERRGSVIDAGEIG